MKKNVIITTLLVTVFAIISLVGALYIFYPEMFISPKQVIDDPIIEEPKPDVPLIEANYILKVAVGNPIADMSTQTYSLNVEIANLPLESDVTFYLIDEQTNYIIAKNSIGEFTAIPPSTNGQYKLEINWKNAKGVEGTPYITTVEGFVPIRKPAPKISAATLERRINECDYSLMSLIPNVGLKFTNLKSDEVKIPQTVGDVFIKIKLQQWAAVKVESVDYNNNNQVTRIELSVVYGE